MRNGSATAGEAADLCGVKQNLGIHLWRAEDNAVFMPAGHGSPGQEACPPVGWTAIGHKGDLIAEAPDVDVDDAWIFRICTKSKLGLKRHFRLSNNQQLHRP